ncbi:hypothetical protein BDR07DRAFT_1401425 [Suillus spraguei]|nr:hypothetical protein BDR07DRAFT_1401425 [Suillus spraguei]
MLRVTVHVDTHNDFIPLSTELIRNTVITNERGQIIYKTYTPFRLIGRTTTICKIKPNLNRFDVLGEIEWHKFASSKFRSGGMEVETKVFIPKRGLWGRTRVFIGPDRRPYRWDLKSRGVVLSRDDGFRMEVARFHRATLGIRGRNVAHMMDTVIMTFIYVEKLRRDKEEASRRATAS